MNIIQKGVLPKMVGECPICRVRVSLKYTDRSIQWGGYPSIPCPTSRCLNNYLRLREWHVCLYCGHDRDDAATNCEKCGAPV